MLGPIHGIRHNGSTREGLRGNLVKRTCELQLDRYNLIQLEHSRIKFDVCGNSICRVLLSSHQHAWSQTRRRGWRTLCPNLLRNSRQRTRCSSSHSDCYPVCFDQVIDAPMLLQQTIWLSASITSLFCWTLFLRIDATCCLWARLFSSQVIQRIIVKRRFDQPRSSLRGFYGTPQLSPCHADQCLPIPLSNRCRVPWRNTDRS